MGFTRIRRSLRIIFGVRGARVAFGRTGTRTTVCLPGAGLSYFHVEKSRDNAFSATPASASEVRAVEAPKDNTWRGCMWIALTVDLGAFVAFDLISSP